MNFIFFTLKIKTYYNFEFLDEISTVKINWNGRIDIQVKIDH